jgi:glyoxylase-like metal-dependent hydrolase (beta-lactamase superfamily II)
VVGYGRITRAFFVTTGSVGGPGAVMGLAKEAGLFGLGPVRMPIAVLVLEHGDAAASVTLVDTGWSAQQVAAPLRTLGPTALFLSVKARPGDDVATQLEARGIARDRVKRIVATHLHNDHVGGLVDFPNAEVITTAPELRSARERGIVHGFDVDALARVGRWTLREVEGPSRFEMPASAELDEGLLLLDVRGHTAGTIGVAATIGGSTIVHLGDAAYTLGEARRGEPSPIAQRTTWDLERQKTTYRAIDRLLRTGAATVVTSHDPGAFREVKDRTWSA